MDPRPTANLRGLSAKGFPLDSASTMVNSERVKSEDAAGSEASKRIGDRGEGEGEP
jgi:hypothetical protein